MHLLYCDETNLEARSGDFFIYGGVSIPSESALNLSKHIDQLKSEYDCPAGVALKFNPCPEELNHIQFTELKQRIVKAAAKHNVHLFSSLILHDIATNPSEARRNGINRICYHFDCYLNRHESQGLVLIDRFSDNMIDRHLVEKFNIGVTGLPYSPCKRLDNIVGFHYSAIGQSHFTSIVDIVLGSFRYAINAICREDEQGMRSAEKILPVLEPLLYRERDNKVSQLSLNFSPNEIRANAYKEKYRKLKEYLYDIWHKESSNSEALPF